MHYPSTNTHNNISTNLNSISHAKFVQSVVEGKDGHYNRVERQIARSWRRCLKEHHLDPAGHHEPVMIERAELLARQQRALQLLDIAKLEMTNLYQQVAGSG